MYITNNQEDFVEGVRVENTNGKRGTIQKDFGDIPHKPWDVPVLFDGSETIRGIDYEWLTILT